VSELERDRWRTRLRPHHGLLALAAGVFVLVYPAALDAALAHAGLRPAALTLAALAAASSLAPPGALRAELALGRAPALGVALLAAGAALLDAPILLRLIAAWVHAVVGYVFAASLREPDSLIERAARFLQPAAPEFIRSYCRRVTALFAGFFFSSALTIATLAWLEPALWRAVSTRWAWAALLTLMLAEFFVRKTHFRYYWYGGPFDRLWSRWFPAQDTEMGRRSAAYIAQMRARLAGDEPPEDGPPAEPTRSRAARDPRPRSRSGS